VHDQADRARAAALRLLVGRELTAQQIRDRLARRGFAAEAIEAAVARLVADGALDDRRAAMVRARQAAAVRGRGPARVLADLQHAGVPPGLARETVDALFAEVDRGALIERALNRKITAGALRDRARAFRRLHAHLVRLGFGSAEAYAAVRARLGPDRGRSPED